MKILVITIIVFYISLFVILFILLFYFSLIFLFNFWLLLFTRLFLFNIRAVFIFWDNWIVYVIRFIVFRVILLLWLLLWLWIYQILLKIENILLWRRHLIHQRVKLFDRVDEMRIVIYLQELFYLFFEIQIITIIVRILLFHEILHQVFNLIETLFLNIATLVQLWELILLLLLLLLQLLLLLLLLLKALQFLINVFLLFLFLFIDRDVILILKVIFFKKFLVPFGGFHVPIFVEHYRAFS